MKENIGTSNYFRPDHYLRYPIVLESASGTNIRDMEGNDYLDLFAAMGAVSCGHGQPLINEALIKQINTLWVSSFFATDIQLEAIFKINSVLPEDIETAALYSTGAEAIEQAVRLARVVTGKRRIISFREHYHGKTHGTIFLLKHFPECYGPRPDSYSTVIESDGTDDPSRIEEYLAAALTDDIAAVIFEPVIGYSGPRLLHKDFLQTVRGFCDRHGIVMIADEILTGFNRCNGWFVSCSEGVSPDIVVFGKGLGNGYPISGVAARSSIAACIKDALPGSTFAGNSLACAAAVAVVNFMSKQNYAEKIRKMEKFFFEFFSQHELQSRGIRLDGMGGLLSIAFEDPSFDHMTDIYLNILKSGVITSHTKTNLRISPPLTITMSEFQRGLEIIAKCLLDFKG